VDLYKSTAHELHDKLVNKEISSVELTKALYERIDAVEDQVKAYVTLDKENALAQAAKVDAMIAAGEKIAPLAGIPGAIKDNICTKGLLTTCSSKMLANVVPIYDAHVIKKLRAEETIFLGKTNMDEFAMGSTTESSYFQATHNPWNLDRVPGGSSGGSAAAIAAGEAIWTLGSDTGGSIRQPASFNGCVGIKPTYGRVSRYGCVAFASSLDQIGPITRDVTDAATVLNTICGKDEHDSTSLPVEVPDFTKALRQDVKGLRIGLPKEYYGEGLDPKVHAELKKAIAQYEAMGAEIVEISLPHTEYAVITYYIIAPAEASAKEGAVLIMCAELADGTGGEGFYTSLRDCETPAAHFEQCVNTPQSETIPDQWESQILARILMKHRVIFVSRPEMEKTLREMKLDYAPDLETAMAMAKRDKGENASVTLIPNGISVMVKS